MGIEVEECSNDEIGSVTFSHCDFIFTINWEDWTKSSFDSILENSWLSRTDLCRYKLDINEEKVLDGEFQFFFQLNINRAVKRRPPEDISGIVQPFSHDKFNFTKASKGELMFTFQSKEKGVLSDFGKNYFIINVSPIEKWHSMLLPSLYKCLNQVITEDSLYYALSALLLSSSPEIRIGFNSLCAFASVNQLHYHIYCLRMPMVLETIKADHLAGRCYVIENHPSKGYVFELTCVSEIAATIRDIYKLTSFLLNENIAHNLYMTRALQFKRSAREEKTSERDCIRIYVWARTSSCGAKELESFAPALAELFGHFVLKTKGAYDTLDEKTTAEILNSITHGPYFATKDRVRELFNDVVKAN